MVKHLLSKAKKQLLNLFSQIPRSLLLLILVDVVLTSGFSVYQYNNFLYNGLDLAIFDQVLWNTAHGDIFEYSFNTHSYLVDHREWLLFLLVPFYWVAGHPITLLILQSIWLGLGAIPVYFLAKKIIGHRLHSSTRVGLFAAVFYLIQPSLLSMHFFEFHFLPLVIPLTLWLWLTVIESRWGMMWVLVVVLLLLREDVALLLIGFGFLLLVSDFHNHAIRKRAVLIIVSSMLWFVAMTVVGVQLSPENSNKFFIIYGWLGETPSEAIQSILHRPLWAASALLDFDHIAVLLHFLLSVSFLAVFRVRYLIPATIPFVLFFMVDSDLMTFVFNRHYGALALPWFIIAGLYGYARLQESILHYELPRSVSRLRLRDFAVVLITFVIVVESIFVGPWSIFLSNLYFIQDRNLDQYRSVLERIGPDDGVIVSDRLYSHLGRRKKLYSVSFLFGGKKHFSEQAFVIPDDIDWLIIEYERFIQYLGYNSAQKDSDAQQGIQKAIALNGLRLHTVTEDLIVFSRELPQDFPLPVIEQRKSSLEHPADILINDELFFHSWEYTATGTHEGDLYLLLERISRHSIIEGDHHIGLIWTDQNGGILKEKIIPLGYGILPTSQWEVGQGSTYRVRLPLQHPEQAKHLQVIFGQLNVEAKPYFSVKLIHPVFQTQFSQVVELSGFFESTTE